MSWWNPWSWGARAETQAMAEQRLVEHVEKSFAAKLGHETMRDAFASPTATEARLEQFARDGDEGLRESFSVQWGGGQATLDLLNEDPRFDDGEPWDEVGVHGRLQRGQFGFPRNETDLRVAREIGRALAEDNPFGRGALRLRKAYFVGQGVEFRARPINESVPENETRKVNAAIREFCEQEDYWQVMRDGVWRADRDGEWLLKYFPRANGLLQVRFWEPDDLRTPTDADTSNLARSSFGVILRDRDGGMSFDARDVEAYNFRQDWANGTKDKQEPRWKIEGRGTLNLQHAKFEVDLNTRRGWPLEHAARKNLVRADKLLRNMGYVAALQAAIALIRKHKSATATEVDAFLNQGKDALVTNTATGKNRYYRAMMPGTVVDAGAGFDYEAPVSSVRVGEKIEVVKAELRAAAASTNMPEYMFSADAASGAFASTLVAEGPAVKTLAADQWDRLRPLKTPVEQAILYEEERQRLRRGALKRHVIECDLPGLAVRDMLQEDQRHEIQHRNRVLSRASWQKKAGLDPKVEDENFNADEAKGITPPEPNPSKTSPGPGDDGPGGADQRGAGGKDPSSAPGRTF